MGKTRRKFGWEGGRGEIPALRKPENLQRGNPERYILGEFDGDEVYEDDHPWTDEEFLENARLCVAVMTEVDRIRALRHRPVDEWTDEEVERVALILRDRSW
jgi:hypothetical protein